MKKNILKKRHIKNHELNFFLNNDKMAQFITVKQNSKDTSSIFLCLIS